MSNKVQKDGIWSTIADTTEGYTSLCGGFEVVTPSAKEYTPCATEGCTRSSAPCDCTPCAEQCSFLNEGCTPLCVALAFHCGHAGLCTCVGVRCPPAPLLNPTRCTSTPHLNARQLISALPLWQFYFMDNEEDTEPRKFFSFDGCIIKMDKNVLEIEVRHVGSEGRAKRGVRWTDACMK